MPSLDRSSLSYAPETSYGAAASSGPLLPVPRTSFTCRTMRNHEVLGRVDGLQGPSAVYRGTEFVEVALESELWPLEHTYLYEDLLGSTWALMAAYTPPSGATITYSTTGQATITLTGTTLAAAATAGLAVYQDRVVSGGGVGAVEGLAFLITNMAQVSADVVLTCMFTDTVASNGGPTALAGDLDPRSDCYVVALGNDAVSSLVFEQAYPDAGLFKRIGGCAVRTCTINVDPSQYPAVVFGMVGRLESQFLDESLDSGAAYYTNADLGTLTVDSEGVAVAKTAGSSWATLGVVAGSVLRVDQIDEPLVVSKVTGADTLNLATRAPAGALASYSMIVPGSPVAELDLAAAPSAGWAATLVVGGVAAGTITAFSLQVTVPRAPAFPIGSNYARAVPRGGPASITGTMTLYPDDDGRAALDAFTGRASTGGVHIRLPGADGSGITLSLAAVMNTAVSLPDTTTRGAMITLSFTAINEATALNQSALVLQRYAS